MAAANPLPIPITAGVTFRAKITISSAGVPTNLTGKTLVFHVLKRDADTDIFAFAVDAAANDNGSRFFITNATGGETRIKIADEDTLFLRKALGTAGGTGRWWISDEAAGEVDEIAGGTFKVSNP
jgi:hypothetical protein